MNVIFFFFFFFFYVFIYLFIVCRFYRCVNAIEPFKIEPYPKDFMLSLWTSRRRLYVDKKKTNKKKKKKRFL